VFARKGTEKDERAKDDRGRRERAPQANKRDEVKIISEAYYNKMRELLGRQDHGVALVDDKGKVLLPEGREDHDEALERGPEPLLARDPARLGDGKIEEQLEQLARSSKTRVIQAVIEALPEKIASSPRATSCRRA
jgi:DNA-directed RNA polymerase subunit beta